MINYLFLFSFLFLGGRGMEGVGLSCKALCGLDLRESNGRVYVGKELKLLLHMYAFLCGSFRTDGWTWKLQDPLTDHGGAPSQCRFGATVEVIDRRRSHERQLHVGHCVNATWNVSPNVIMCCILAMALHQFKGVSCVITQAWSRPRDTHIQHTHITHTTHTLNNQD